MIFWLTKKRKAERAIRRNRDKYKIFGFSPNVSANMPQVHCLLWKPSARCGYWILEMCIVQIDIGRKCKTHTRF